MTNDIYLTEAEMSGDPTVFDKILASVFIALCVAFLLVGSYWIGAYRTVKSMEASFSEHGEVILEFYGSVYPQIFDSL